MVAVEAYAGSSAVQNTVQYRKVCTRLSAGNPRYLTRLHLDLGFVKIPYRARKERAQTSPSKASQVRETRALSP